MHDLRKERRFGTWVGTLMLCAACTRSSESALYHVPASTEPRQFQALRQVIGDRPVQWISPREACVVPFDAKTEAACDARPRTGIPAITYQRMRALTPVPTSELSFVRCARVSHEVHDGDSLLVSVSTVDGNAIDRTARRNTMWIWFRRAKGQETLWPGLNPNPPDTNVAPLKGESEC